MATDIYSKFARPAATIVAAGGVFSCAMLILFGEPQVPELDSATLRYSLLGILAVFGALVPGVIATTKASASPGKLAITGLFLALTANAVVLGGKLLVFPQTAFMLLSIAICLGLCTTGALAIAEVQTRKPPRSKF